MSEYTELKSQWEEIRMKEKEYQNRWINATNSS